MSLHDCGRCERTQLEGGRLGGMNSSPPADYCRLLQFSAACRKLIFPTPLHGEAKCSRRYGVDLWLSVAMNGVTRAFAFVPVPAAT